jgi:hypothetical protein
MKTKYFLLLFILIAGLSFGQTFTLKGRITNAENGLPIQGATVFVSYSSFAYSNGDGFYSLSGLNA